MNAFALIKDEKKQVIFTIIVELIIIGLLGILLLWFSNRFIISNPSKPAFRIVGSIAQLLVLTLFISVKFQSIKSIGLSWESISLKNRKYYLIGFTLVFALIISGCFFMPFFAFTMNLRFGIIAVLFEEIVFRGYIWQRLKEKEFDDISLIVLTALFFGLFHLTYYYEVNYAKGFFKDAPNISTIMRQKVLANIGYGFFLGYVRYKSKNLYLPMIIHSIGNIIGQ